MAADRDALDPEWRKEEIARRIERVERGEVVLLDGDDVLRELRERFPELGLSASASELSSRPNHFAFRGRMLAS